MVITFYSVHMRAATECESSGQFIVVCVIPVGLVYLGARVRYVCSAGVAGEAVTDALL